MICCTAQQSGHIQVPRQSWLSSVGYIPSPLKFPLTRSLRLSSVMAKNHERHRCSIRNWTVACLKHYLRVKGIIFSRYRTRLTHIETPVPPASMLGSCDSLHRKSSVVSTAIMAHLAPTRRGCWSHLPGRIFPCACSLCVKPASAFLSFFLIPVFAGFTASLYTYILPSHHPFLYSSFSC